MGDLAKKAQYDLGRKVLYFTVALFVLTFIFFYTNRTFAKYDTKLVDNADWVENMLIMNELANSPRCFSFVDNNIDRAYPGIFDPEKLTGNGLGKDCLAFTKKKVLVEIGNITVGEAPAKSVEFKRTILLREPDGLVPKLMVIKIENS